MLDNRSSQLAGVGQWEESFSASTEAVNHYRELAATRPDVGVPELAEALYDQSVPFAELGRRDEALSAVTEAVSLYTPLFSADPDSHRDDYAKAVELLRRLN